jgi:hypothetical protein
MTKQDTFLWLQGTLMDVLKCLPSDHPQRLSATILPLCLVASRKVEAAGASISKPLEAIVPHDSVVCSALEQMAAALGAERPQQLGPAEEGLVYASAVQAACVALNNFRTPPFVLFTSSPCAPACTLGGCMLAVLVRARSGPPNRALVGDVWRRNSAIHLNRFHNGCVGPSVAACGGMSTRLIPECDRSLECVMHACMLWAVPLSRCLQGVSKGCDCGHQQMQQVVYRCCWSDATGRGGIFWDDVQQREFEW